MEFAPSPYIILPKDSLLNQAHVEQFRATIRTYYENAGRDFSWRQQITPYRIVVSEIMLQQTQAGRVSQKFDSFITLFPDFKALAEAPFDVVLRAWKGLGYNRRAQALQKIARLITDDYEGLLPDDPKILQTFPGIGPATASSIVTFAYNKPTVFIETNIRTVFIYTFFHNSINIQDCDLIPLIEQTLDRENSRKWYYALMDYGVMLKKEIGNFSRLSAHHTQQSKFEGSDRQIRGMILQVLLDQPGISQEGLLSEISKEPARVMRILHDLQREGFTSCLGGFWRLAS